MFIAPLFTIAKRWEQPKYPSMDEWLKMCVCVFKGRGWGVKNCSSQQMASCLLDLQVSYLTTGLWATGWQPQKALSVPPGKLFIGIGEKCPLLPWGSQRGRGFPSLPHGGNFLPAIASPRWGKFTAHMQPQIMKISHRKQPSPCRAGTCYSMRVPLKPECTLCVGLLGVCWSPSQAAAGWYHFAPALFLTTPLHWTPDASEMVTKEVSGLNAC